MGLFFLIPLIKLNTWKFVIYKVIFTNKIKISVLLKFFLLSCT